MTASMQRPHSLINQFIDRIDTVKIEVFVKVSLSAFTQKLSTETLVTYLNPSCSLRLNCRI